jgi:hypothetical protein
MKRKMPYKIAIASKQVQITWRAYDAIRMAIMPKKARESEHWRLINSYHGKTLPMTNEGRDFN